MCSLTAGSSHDQFRSIGQSRFEPQLIAKYQRCFPGFDEKIIALYARGNDVPKDLRSGR